MNNKTKFKAGLFFGIAMGAFYILQGLFTRTNLSSKEITILIISGLVAGAIAGFLFGLVIGLFANSKRVANKTKIATNANETILFSTGANHFQGMEAVGGKLYLTNKRLVFRSHSFNIQNHELSMDINEINEVGRFKTLGIVNNGLSVTTTYNKTEKFVVQQIGEWLKQMTEKKGLSKIAQQS